MFFAFILVFIYCDDSAPLVQLGSTPPEIKKPYFTFLMAITIIAMIYFVLAFFGGLCCCEPDNSLDPDCFPMTIHIISAVVIIIGSILIFAGVSKVTYKNDNSRNGLNTKQNPYFSDITAIIQNPFQQNVKTLTQIYDNISKADSNSKSLEKTTINYSTIFTDSNNEYRVSFNNLYLKPNVAAYLKYSLKSMDDSLSTFLSDLFTFIYQYNSFSEKVKNTLKSINDNYVRSSEEAIHNLEKKLDELSYEFNEQNQISSLGSSSSYISEINIVFGYITASGALVIAVIYTGLYFCGNACSRCCFCSYPLWALLVLASCYLAGFIMFHKSYSQFSSFCRGIDYYSYRAEDDVKKAIENALFESRGMVNNFEIDLDLVNFFDRDEIEKLYGRMSSKSVHMNYKSIFVNFAIEKEYRKDLVSIVSIIKSQSNKLLKMRDLFESITDFSFTIVPTLKKLQENALPSINESIENMIEISTKSSSASQTCNSILTGSNCILVGVFFITVGFVALSVTVCLRRVDMDDYGSVGSDYSPRGTESMKAYYYGKHTMYFLAYLDSSTKVDWSGILQSGKWGKGLYFSETSGKAFSSFINNTDKSSINVERLVICECTVDFGRILEVPVSCTSKYSFPDSLHDYDAVSVMGHNSNGITQYVIFDTDRFTITGYGEVDPQKLNAYINQHYK